MPFSEPRRALTGIAGLDDILHGGLIAGRLYLVEGNPGSGKTTLALQYLLEGVRQGEKCLYITLSETADELRAGAHSHGWSLDGIEIVELITDGSSLDGDSELTMYHPSEIELTATTRQMLEAVEHVRPARLVFDSLSELRLLAQSSLRYRRQILALKQFFIGRDCTVLLLDDCTAEGPDMQLQSIAHGVIQLSHTSPNYGRALRQVQVVKFRGSDFRSGLQDFGILKGGLRVYPRLTAREHAPPYEPERIASGVAALDALMGGGVDRGTSTLLVGPPGTGKSTIALQYAVAVAARGHHATIFAFEENRTILKARAASIGMALEEGIGPGKIRIRQIDPVEIAPGAFAHMVRQAVEDDDARVVVVDSLNGYLNAMPEDRALTAQLHEMLSFLNNCGVATFLVAAQSGMLGLSMRAPVDASYLADTVVMTRMFEHAGKVKKAISVVKKRSGAHEESIRELRMDSRGLHLSEPLTNLRGVLAGVPIELGIPTVGTRHAPARDVD